MLLAELPLQAARALCTRIGDTFAWLCGLAAISLALSLLRKRQ